MYTQVRGIPVNVFIVEHNTLTLLVTCQTLPIVEEALLHACIIIK